MKIFVDSGDGGEREAGFWRVVLCGLAGLLWVTSSAPVRAQSLAEPAAQVATSPDVAAVPSAQPGPAGALDARPLFGFAARHGGAVSLDVWLRLGMFRLGAMSGIGALSGNDEVSSRVLTPLALSFALVPRADGAGWFGLARLGGYLGAEKGGFIRGLFASGALGYGFALGEGASIRVGADLWGLAATAGGRGGVFVGPMVGLGF